MNPESESNELQRLGEMFDTIKSRDDVIRVLGVPNEVMPRGMARLDKTTGEIRSYDKFSYLRLSDEFDVLVGVSCEPPDDEVTFLVSLKEPSTTELLQ